MVAYLLDVGTVQGEGAGHQVRHVVAEQSGGVHLLGQTRIEVGTELGDAVTQHAGVERHVDTGHVQERRS